MILYAESSAVLTWLLTQEHASEIGRTLAEAELVLSSDLTLLECERALLRGSATGDLSEGDVAHRQAILRTAARHWMLLGFAPAVIERAQRSFPNEPVRTLDALHLAFALEARQMVAEVTILSLDRRIRESARRLGLELTRL